MSSIKVKETKASRLRAGKTYGTPSQSTSKSPRSKKSTVNKKTPVSSSIDKKKWICGVCSESLRNQNSVGCDGQCKKWFHASCAGVDNQHFKALQEDKDLEWTCSTCTDKNPGKCSSSEPQDIPGPLTQALRKLRMSQT